MYLQENNLSCTEMCKCSDACENSDCSEKEDMYESEDEISGFEWWGFK